MMPISTATPGPSPRTPADRPVIRPGRWSIFPDTADGYERDGQKAPRLMVPVDGRRLLTLYPPLPLKREPVDIANDSDGNVIADWLGQHCCRAVLSGHMLAVHGLSRPCRIPVELRQDDAALQIIVTVKERLLVPLIVHSVEHGPLHKTRMTSAMLGAMIDAANRILEPQANVSLSVIDERPLSHETIGKRLGRTVTARPGDAPDEWDLVTQRADRTGQPRLLNLFLVRRYDEPGSAPRGATANGCTIIEDHIRGGQLDAAAAGRTLAHEVGHHLADLPDLKDPGDTERLMYWKEGGDRITADEADRMNPRGVR